MDIADENLAKRLDEFDDYLSNRTLGPLRRAGIITVKDLIFCSDEQIHSIKGFGAKCYDEVLWFCENFDTIMENKLVSEQRKEATAKWASRELELSEWMNENLKPRYIEVLAKFYGLVDGEQRTLDMVGEELDVTRERVRQMKKSALKKIRMAFSKGKIDAGILDELKMLAEKETRLLTITSLSYQYDNRGMARMLTEMLEVDWIYKDRRLKTE